LLRLQTSTNEFRAAQRQDKVGSHVCQGTASDAIADGVMGDLGLPYQVLSEFADVGGDHIEC